MVVSRNVSVVGPTLGRKHTMRRLVLPAPQILYHRMAVKRIRDGLPYPDIFQNRIPNIETNVGQPRAPSFFDGKIWIFLQRGHGVRSQRVDGDVSATFAEFEGL